MADSDPIQSYAVRFFETLMVRSPHLAPHTTFSTPPGAIRQLGTLSRIRRKKRSYLFAVGLRLPGAVTPRGRAWSLPSSSPFFRRRLLNSSPTGDGQSSVPPALPILYHDSRPSIVI